MQALINSIKTFPARRPVLFGLGFSCTKTSFADYLVQRFVEKREEIDLKRNASFAAFGFFYLGGVQYAIYVPFFGRLFPTAASFAAKPLADKLADPKGMLVVAAQVFLDQCVHHPFMYFPSFYITRECIENGVSMAGVQKAINKYRVNMREDMVALWKVWVPVTFVNFAVSPMWARIPVVATTSLGWTCILSAMRGASNEIELNPESAMEMVGNKGRSLARIRHRAAQLDPNKAHIVLTAVGPKGTSLPKLAQLIMEGTGNVLESRGMRMGNDLTVMMLIEVDPSRSTLLTAALQGGALLSDYKIFTHTLDPAGLAAPEQGAPRKSSRFSMAAPDKPGLIHLVTSFLERQGLHVVDVNCEQRETGEPDGAGGSKRMFFMEGFVAGEVPSEKDFKQQLRELKKEHGVTLQLTPVREEDEQ